MQKMLFHHFSVLYHMFFHFPVSDYGTQTAILPVMTLAAYTYCFFPLSSRTCCHAFTTVTLRSTNIEKSIQKPAACKRSVTVPACRWMEGFPLSTCCILPSSSQKVYFSFNFVGFFECG